jgi:uncharacterized protein (DUF169 family)
MTNYADLSKILVDSLGLRNEPVAVTLIKKGQDIPSDYHVVDGATRHCQSIMKARKGEKLCVPAERNACPVGSSALGECPIPEKVRSGEFHHKTGMYDSEAAAAKMIEMRTALPEGSVIATVVSPLSEATVEPDVVIVVGLPEQIYWIVPVAETYMEGGRATLTTASFQASCVDTTIIPFLTGKVNISLGCLGCRKNSDILPEEMLVGIPWSQFENIVAVIEKMSKGAIPKARQRN